MKTIETHHLTVESKSINVEIRKLQEFLLSEKKILKKQSGLLSLTIGLMVKITLL